MDLANKLQAAPGHLAAQAAPWVVAHPVRSALRARQAPCSSPQQGGSVRVSCGRCRCSRGTRVVLRRLHAVAEDASATSDEAPAEAAAEPEEEESAAPAAQKAAKIALKDIEVGGTYESKVMKIMNFGAFVDIGAECDGLVHISEISKGFVSKVEDVLKVGQVVNVKILGVEVDTKRVSCSMKALLPDEKKQESGRSPPKDGRQRQQRRKDAPEGRGRSERRSSDQGGAQRKRRPTMRVGQEVKGKVDNVLDWGAFIDLEDGQRALLHVQEMRDVFTSSDDQRADAHDYVEAGKEMTLRVRSVDNKGNFTLTERTPEEIAFLEKVSKSGYEYKPEGEVELMLGTLIKQAGVTRDMFPDLPERAVYDEDYEEPAPAGSGHPKAELEAPAETPAEAPAEPPVVSPTASPVPVVADSSSSATEEAAVSSSSKAEAEKESDGAPAVTISAKAVKQLRDMTGAGMMDCKKALTECGGVMEEAVEYLQKKGIASAAKRAGRIASEGLVHSYITDDGMSGVLAEINCETDFVARGDQFKDLVAVIAKQIADCPDVACVSVDDVPEALLASGASKESLALLSQPCTTEDGKTVNDLLIETSAGIGEKLAVRRFERYNVGAGRSEENPQGLIGSYVHAGKQGVMVEVSCESKEAAQGDVLKDFALDMALQITASPDVRYVSQDNIPAAVAEKEKEMEMAKEDLLSKPEQIRGKIAEGRVAKTLQAMCLLDQPFVKDQGKTVAEVVADASKSTGEQVEIQRFERFVLGEGLEKRSDDFAAEVAAQMGKA
ncbi:unnamed protein product [Ostreobium quekettii]|uniref:Elongation factor Ts, mitochondrial n=1 Tax=Ostreobium quekettii TaxID=121088 RepID=A0A8S1IQA0_9CHLO|nr:unnamed protein product [Ostreobium quekettii]|eukprot:evm.model.scf_79.10 EVM.evm.TU.scf_79.10   scf_79:73035-78415(+)